MSFLPSSQTEVKDLPSTTLLLVPSTGLGEPWAGEGWLSVHSLPGTCHAKYRGATLIPTSGKTEQNREWVERPLRPHGPVLAKLRKKQSFAESSRAGRNPHGSQLKSIPSCHIPTLAHVSSLQPSGPSQPHTCREGEDGGAFLHVQALENKRQFWPRQSLARQTRGRVKTAQQTSIPSDASLAAAPGRIRSQPKRKNSWRKMVSPPVCVYMRLCYKVRSPYSLTPRLILGASVGSGLCQDGGQQTGAMPQMSHRHA